MSPEQAVNKGSWEGDEDNILVQLHSAYGPNWTRISEALGTRSAKQCRERYTQQLRPGLNRSPISEDEGRRIMEMVQECGQRWAQIARNLGTNRSDNQIKNWWNGAKRKETSKRQDVAPTPGQQLPQDLSPTLGLAALSERRGVLPPSRLDLPFRPDHLPPPTVTDISARSYLSDRPPSLVSDHGSTWSISPPAYSPLALPPLLPSPQHQQQDGYYLSPGPKQNGFGPARRSSEVLHHPPRSYLYHSSSPQSCYAKTAPTSPINRASSRWEPYRTSGRRPSTGYLKDEKSGKGSLAFMLN